MITGKPKKKLKNLALFDVGKIEIKDNRVKPTNDFIEFKKEDIHQSVGACFEQKVKQYADKVAVKSNDNSITYGFLNSYANRVAQGVLQEYDDRFRLSESEKTRYARQMLLHEWGIGSQEKLKSTTVFAVGAGGSGSPLLQQLALIGIGTIIVCDHDEVELSNLNRQVLHDESRIGMNKALSAKITLNKINPHVQVIAYPGKITRDNIEELAGDAQIIFDNVDDLEAKFVLSEYAVGRRIPHILSSMIDLNAYAVVLHSPYTPCFHCRYDREILEKIETIKAYSTNYQKSPNPVASPALFLCTGFAVNEAIKILLGFENPAYNKYVLFNQRGVRDIVGSDAYRRLTYPFMSHFKKISREQGKDWDRGWEGPAVEEIRIKPDPLCPVCDKNKKAEGKPFYRLKASKPVSHKNSNALDDVQHFTAFSADSVHLKKPSVGPKGLIGPPCHGAPWQAVALLFGHGIEMVIGLLGVLKSGKVYVPLDPTYPLERLEYMLEDSEARVIVTEGRHYSLAEALKNKVNKNIKVIDIEEMKAGEMIPGGPGIAIEPGQVAYVLYTSGSTGLPKGVMQSHRNVLHFARVYTNALHIHEGDRLPGWIRKEQITKSVVVCQQEANGENYLTAFYQSAGGIDLDENKLVRQLKAVLSDYMVPGGFYRLDDFPLTPTGKIDRKALSDKNMVQRLNRIAYAAPRSEIEKKMAEIWSRVLNKDGTLGIDDNFFVLGGNSLKAILVTSRIHKELAVKVSLAEMFKSPTIRELARYIDEPGGEVFESIGAAERKEYYPLSSAQNRFYILQQVTPGSTAYHMTQIHQLEGKVEKERFEASLKKMIERHETLRTSFQLIDGQPVQRVHDGVEFAVEYSQVEAEEGIEEGRVEGEKGRRVEEKEMPFGQVLDAFGGSDNEGTRGLAPLSVEFAERKAQSAVRKEERHAPCAVRCASTIKNFIRPFELTRAPLLQFGLIDISKDRYILMFRMHHIISDGTSMTILLQEFMTIYSSQPLTPLRLQYKDFAQWQFNRLITGQLKQQEAYWLERFPGEPPVLNMPTDFPRPPIQSYEGNYFNFSLEKSVTNEINHLLKDTGTTLFMLLLAIYNILLSRYTGQEDIIIGTTVAGRSHADLEPIIGLFIETLALRNYPFAQQTFEEFLKEVKQTTLATYDNQEYPFKELIKQVGAENEISRNPVFDVMLIVQNIERTAFELKGLNFSPYQVSEEESPRMSKVDLTIEAAEAAGEIYFKLEYCTRLYKKETMERLSGHFINIIGEVVDNPAIRLSDIRVIGQ